jgi:hypothetical protein
MRRTKHLLLIKIERCTQEILCLNCPFKFSWSGNKHNNTKMCPKNKIRIRR